MVWWSDHGLGRNRIGRLITKKSGRWYVEGSPSEWAQTLKISASHMNAQRVPTAEQDFNNQVNKMTCSLGQTLPSHPKCLFNGPMNEAATEAEMENTQPRC